MNLKTKLTYFIKEKRAIFPNVVSFPVQGEFRRGMLVLFFVILLPYVITAVGFRGSGKYGKHMAAGEISKIKIEIMGEYGTRRMDMETYLIGKLAAVIPGDYEEEALKAQAILLRTSLIREYKERIEKGMARYTVEEEAASFFSLEQMRSIWGKDFNEIYEKMTKAVRETRGIYITFDGEPILAAFFRVSTGRTMDMEEVSGSLSYPYLKSVSCPKDYLAEEYLSDGEVSGLGHGMGMSQFGANEMAKMGSTYYEILNYFFTDIAIDKFE